MGDSHPDKILLDNESNNLQGDLTDISAKKEALLVQGTFKRLCGCSGRLSVLIQTTKPAETLLQFCNVVSTLDSIPKIRQRCAVVLLIELTFFQSDVTDVSAATKTLEVCSLSEI